MPGRISLLHLSDLHFESSTRSYALKDYGAMCLRGRKSSYDIEDAEVITQWIWENRNEYHAILISGDLADTGHESDLETALKYIDSKVTKNGKPWLTTDSFPTISTSSENIFLLPGNHDRFDSPGRKPNAVNFDNIFVDYWSFGAYVRGKNSTFFLSDNDEVGLSIVSVDFSLEDYTHSEEGLAMLISRRRFGYYGQGKVYDKRIDALVSATNKIKRKFPNYPVIWAMHYELSNKKSSMKLLNEAQFINAIIENDIECVLNGHTHNENVQIIGDTCKAITSATPFANAILHNNSFSIIDFYVDGDKILDVKINPVCYKNYEFQPHEITR